MKSIKYILTLLILTSSAYSNCFICGVVPQEWNIHMASNEYADEIKKKKKKKERNSRIRPKVKKVVLGVYLNLNGKRGRRMDNPLATFYRWQVSSGALDGWTSYHIAAGLFIAKVAQWLGSSDFWAVMWVVIIGILWEIFEVYVEGTEETYGTKKRWAINTASDLFVEIGAAWWMVI